MTDLLTKEAEDLAGQLAATKRELEVTRAILVWWPFHLRELIRTGDVEGMKAEAVRRERWLTEICAERYALVDEVAELRRQLKVWTDPVATTPVAPRGDS